MSSDTHVPWFLKSYTFSGIVIESFITGLDSDITDYHSPYFYLGLHFLTNLSSVHVGETEECPT